MKQGGFSYWHLSAIEAFAAWQVTTGSPEVVIAILDDGVDIDHHAFPNQLGTHFNAINGSNNHRPQPLLRPGERGQGVAGSGSPAPRVRNGTTT